MQTLVCWLELEGAGKGDASLPFLQANAFPVPVLDSAPFFDQCFESWASG